MDDVPGPGGTAPVRERREMLGGKGANIAVGLAQLGAPVRLVGVVGADDVGERLIARAAADGIATESVVRRPDCATGLAIKGASKPAAQRLPTKNRHTPPSPWAISSARRPTEREVGYSNPVTHQAASRAASA